MKNNGKKQPRAVGFIATEGLEQLVLSSFLPKLVKQKYPKAKTVLFTTKNTAHHSECFGYDEIVTLSGNKIQDTSKLVFYSRVKGVSLFLDLNRGQQSYFGFSDSIADLRSESQLRLSLPELYMTLVSKLEIEATKLDLKLQLPMHVYHGVGRRLLDSGLELDQLFVLAPDVYSENEFTNKTWSTFSELGKTAENKIVVIAGQKLNAIIKSLDQNKFYVWDGNREPFEETLALISHAKKFIGIDTLWTHVARQLGVPTAGIYGPSLSPSPVFLKAQKDFRAMDATLPCSPCQEGTSRFNFQCQDPVCMKSHSAKEVMADV